MQNYKVAAMKQYYIDKDSMRNDLKSSNKIQFEL